MLTHSTLHWLFYGGRSLTNFPSPEAKNVLGSCEERLDFILDMARIGCWEWNAVSGTFYCSESAKRIFGLLHSDIGSGHCLFDIVHEDDRPMLERLVGDCLAGTTPSAQLRYRILMPDGSLRYLSSSVRVLYDRSEKPVSVVGTVQDITELKELESAARQSDENYRRLSDIAEDFIFVVDRDLRITFVNPSGAASLGMKREDIIGKYLNDLFPSETFERMENNLQAVFDTGKSIEDIHVHKFFLEEYWLHVRLTPIVDCYGRVTQVMGISRDVTRHTLAEKALGDSEKKFRVLTETTAAAICIIQDGKFQYVNQAMEAISGYSQEELLSMDFLSVVHPDERDYVKRRYLYLLENEKPMSPRLEFRGIARDGGIKWIDASTGIIDFKGRPAIIATGFDVTGRKLIEEALISSEANLARAQKIARLGNWVWDRKTNLINASEELFRIFGVDWRADSKVETFSDRVHPDDKDRMYKAISALLYENKSCSLDHRIVLPDGKERFIHSEVEVIRDRDGEPLKVFGVVQDITDRKLAEKALEDAKNQAELYVDLMGHDINNMNQIAMGYLEMVGDMPGLDDDQRDLIERPVEVLNRSSRLISNVRKLQKISRETPRLETVDAGRVIQDAVKQFSDIKGKHVTIEHAPVNGCFVKADALLYDVFSNLIDNSIKHTGASQVKISIVLDRTTDNGRTFYKVTIDDNGPGISDGLKERIFNRQLRGNTKAKGSGIGLYLVKKLVDNYHGQVWVEDKVPGDHTKGSRFVVTLPAVE